MKLTDRRNIVAMGLDPDEVISFAGGWVNHRSPDGLRAEYSAIAGDERLFHELGAYSPTRGLPRLRDALLSLDRAFYGTEGLADEHLIVGQSSTQLTHTLFTALLDPGDRVLLFDPSYANYAPQLALGPDGVEITRLPVLDPEDWTFMADPDRVLKLLAETLERDEPRLMLFSTPDNPTSRIVPDDSFFQMLEMAQDAGCFVAVDYAYRAQCFLEEQPAQFAASPVRHPNLIRLHSNSKWCRGLGRRLGWIEVRWRPCSRARPSVRIQSTSSPSLPTWKELSPTVHSRPT
jgi:aspartate/methionine/tyrosine aminotransferase